MSKTKDKKKEMAKKMKSNEGVSYKGGESKQMGVKYKGGEPTNEAGGDSGAGSDKKERKYKLPKGSEDKR